MTPRDIIGHLLRIETGAEAFDEFRQAVALAWFEDPESDHAELLLDVRLVLAEHSRGDLNELAARRAIRSLVSARPDPSFRDCEYLPGDEPESRGVVERHLGPGLADTGVDRDRGRSQGRGVEVAGR
jgi:hypothetical protein